MSTPLDGRENFRTLWSYRHPLGVTCQACGHRALIRLKKLKRLGIEYSDKTKEVVQQAVDLHLLRADTRDDPASVWVTCEGTMLTA